MAKDLDFGPLWEWLKACEREINRSLTSKALDMISVATIELEISTRKNLNKKGGRFAKRRGGGAGLAGSWQEVLVTESRRGSSAFVEVGSYSPLPYAEIHELGGTIDGKNKKLAIPITSAALNAGSPLNWPADALQWVPGKKKQGVFIDSENTAHYALRDSVDIKPTGYITKAAIIAGPKMRKLAMDKAYDIMTSTHAVFGVS